MEEAFLLIVPAVDSGREETSAVGAVSFSSLSSGSAMRDRRGPPSQDRRVASNAPVVRIAPAIRVGKR